MSSNGELNSGASINVGMLGNIFLQTFIAAKDAVVEKNVDEERLQNNTLVWKPPWTWCNGWQLQKLGLFLVYADTMDKLYWSIAWVSDLFTWWPPW